MRFFLFGFLLLLLSSCGPYMEVQYDDSVDVSQYKTYNFYPTLSTNLTKEETVQVMQLISFQLFKYGYQKSETPDFYVNFFVEENTYAVPKYDEEDVNNEIDREENEENNEETETPKPRTLDLELIGLDQTLFLDIVDVEKDQLAWTATISGYLDNTPTQKTLYAYYTEILEKAFKKFYATTH